MKSIKYPKISVNIPLIKGGDASIVLKYLKKVNYPKNKLEIIIIEGNQIAAQRNVGVKHSSGSIIYLLDDDSRVNKDAFKIITREFKDKSVAAVGGPSLPLLKSKGYINQLIGYSLATYFGSMRMKFRYNGNSKNVNGSEYNLVGANLALRKSYIKKVGYFNEKIVPNEETELIRRLKNAGYKLIYNKNLYIRRNQRKNFTGLFRQFHHYGRGRMKQIINKPTISDILFLGPILFFIYFISLIIFNTFYNFIPLVLYLLLALATSIKAAFKYHRFDLLITLPIIFPIIHISYTIGLLNELYDKLLGTKINNKKVRVVPKLIFIKA
jgi:succinoglycan biosynthesis protein ExoA